MNPLRTSRWIRRAILPVAILCGVVFFSMYGSLSVPPGMDTMPDVYPPGTVCLIRKWPGVVPEGKIVFVDVNGGTLLTRVARVTADGILVRNDNEDSRLPDGEALGVIPFDKIRGLVLTGFPPDAPGGGRGR